MLGGPSNQVGRISKHVDVDVTAKDTLTRQRGYEVVQLPNWTDASTFQAAGYKQHAGTLEIANTAGLFFWLLHRSRPHGKLLIWLNGGPGCTDGLILEHGVFELSTQGGANWLKTRKGGWHTFANVLAVDQPVGTGYSRGKRELYVRTVGEAVEMFHEFLAKFFEVFPAYADDEVYIGGESFAGVWIPNFAAKILQRPGATKVNLKGLAIGSGWVDPKNQFPSLLPAVETNDLLAGSKLVEFRKRYHACLSALQGAEDYTAICEDMGQSINQLSKQTDAAGQETCINQYDFRLRDHYPECGMGWPPNVQGFHEYMGSKDVAAALHAKLPEDGWHECDPQVYNALSKLNFSSIELFHDLLESVSILLFVGDKDLLVNEIGVGYLVGNFTAAESKKAPRLRVSDPDDGVWRTWGTGPNLNAGKLARWGKLTQVSIYNASHMASYDRPNEVASLLRWFISGQPTLALPPTPEDAPGFYLHPNATGHPTFTQPSPSSNTSDLQAKASAILSNPQTTTPSPAVMGFALVVTLGVLGCLVASLLRSRIRRPFNPDAQELLTTDDTELGALPPGNPTDADHPFEFHDSDDETPTLPAL